MAITQLNLTPGRRESDWILNVLETNASGGIDLKAAIPDYRYGVNSLTVTMSVSGKWFKILDGNTTLIGPVTSVQYVPYHLDFSSTVYATAGNALVLKTEEAFPIHCVIEGKTGPPIPSKSFNPSPADGATGVSTSTDLAWDSIYQSVNYKVYFGTTELSLVSEQSEKTYTPSLEANTNYMWRIDETLNGNEAKGDVWTFITGA